MYDKHNLPPVKVGSRGYLLPTATGTVAACMAPVATEWPFPANWGKPEGATMPVPAGGMITCLGQGDSYYNAEFAATSSVIGPIKEGDPRAEELSRLWRQRGYEVLVVEAVKNVGLEVIGTPAAEAIGHELATREGVEIVQVDDVIVRCPRSGDVWRITPPARVKRYAEQGRVFEGELPQEYR